MNTRKDLAVHEWGLLDLKPLLMKSTLAAFGDTGAAPGSSTKASLQKKKGDEGTIGGFFFFLSLSFFCLPFHATGDRRDVGESEWLDISERHKEKDKMGNLPGRRTKMKSRNKGMVELKVRERLLLLNGLRCVLSWTVSNHDHSRHEHTDF